MLSSNWKPVTVSKKFAGISGMTLSNFCAKKIASSIYFCWKTIFLSQPQPKINFRSASGIALSTFSSRKKKSFDWNPQPKCRWQTRNSKHSKRKPRNSLERAVNSSFSSEGKSKHLWYLCNCKRKLNSRING